MSIYFKQVKLFNPQTTQPEIYVYGAGSIGSHVVVGLAKMGLTNITVYDFDKVEADNLPAQFYDTISVGELKTEALHKMSLKMTGTPLWETVEEKIDEDTVLTPSQNSIHIMAFDNIEARKLVISKLEGYPVHIIDGRIGGFNWEKYYLQGEEDNTEYLKTLEGTFSELECGEKTLWGVNSLIASKILADVIKISKTQRPSYMQKGHLLSHIVIDKRIQ